MYQWSVNLCILKKCKCKKKNETKINNTWIKFVKHTLLNKIYQFLQQCNK